MRAPTHTTFGDLDDAMLTSARDDGSANVLVALGNSGGMVAVLNPASREAVAAAFANSMRYEASEDTEVTVLGFDDHFAVTGAVHIG